MKALFVLIATGLFGEIVLAETPTNSTKLQQLILKRCKANSENAAAYDKILEFIDEFTDYLKVAFSHIPEGKKQFCDEDQPNLVRLSRTLANSLKECFVNEEEYLPKFWYQSFVQFIHFLCDNNGQNIDNIFSQLGGQCMKQLKNEGGGTEVRHCFAKVTAPLDGKVTKENLCKDITIAKKCFNVVLTKHCPDFLAFEKLNDKLFDAVLQPCNACCSLGFSNLAVILVAFVFIKNVILTS